MVAFKIVLSDLAITDILGVRHSCVGSFVSGHGLTKPNQADNVDLDYY